MYATLPGLKVTILFGVLVALLTPTPASARKRFSEEPLDVSMIQLIANPKQFDGKVVRVIGYLRLEFEGNALYVHHDDYRFGIPKNGLWASMAKGLKPRPLGVNNKYVIAVGVFNANHMGHMALWSGAIENITRLDLWDDPRSPIHGKLE